MPWARRRKIEVPTDYQPHFELRDTAEDIERRRRREKGDRVERETQEERDRKKLERQRTEGNTFNTVKKLLET